MTETETDPPVMGVEETALRLQVSVSTVRRYLARGLLRGYRTAGGHRKITVESVELLRRETIGHSGVHGLAS